MIGVKCLCGETHQLPESGRVWFLNPANHEFARMVMAGAPPEECANDPHKSPGVPAIPCRLVPRGQAFNIDAWFARKDIGTIPAGEIVETP